eukprot:TRINITY_DN1859_c0_g1_i1.p2 TRINITY_DN1859_c0_g1~~TRINITY_DN1859_c0_g1_i1.p2  ORF type:complete len:125 (+),score=20.86 TRINITY_DN1859_c0_g1_i1:240-614(+)
MHRLLLGKPLRATAAIGSAALCSLFRNQSLQCDDVPTTPVVEEPPKPKKKRKAKQAKPPMMVGGSECPLCAMVKAGPCRPTFFPFEECMKRCEKTGQDTWAGCKDEFMEMIGCMAQVQLVAELS